MRKTHLPLGPANMSAIERRMGRFMRGPDGHGGGGEAVTGSDIGGGGDSGGSGNNGGGNPASGSTDSGGENNPGQDFDATSFWNDPASEGGNGTDTNDSTPDDSGQQTGREVVEAISNFAVDPLFTAETAQQISEGNFESVNQGMQTMMQNVMRQTIGLTARIMQDFERTVDSRVSQAINQNDTRHGDDKLLTDSFTSFSNPAMQPMIRGVFSQSLRHTKGDRQAAVKLTRNMLQTMGQFGSSDFGIREAPRGPDDYQSDGPSSLVDELLGKTN